MVIQSDTYHRGFTLIEIIATLLLLSILAGLGLMLADTGGDGRDVATQLDLLRNHIRYAQSMAMKDRTIWSFHYTGSSFWVSDSTGQRALPGTETPIQSAVSVTPDRNGAIYFDIYGIPCSDNATAAPLTASTTFTVTAGSASESISLVPDTGYVQ